MGIDKLSRRAALVAGAATLFAPVLVRAQSMADPDSQTGVPMADRPAIVPTASSNHNIGSFRAIEWQDHYDDIDQVTLIADTRSRALHYWNAGGTDHRVYPTSVPLTEELTKRGYTKVVRKKIGPSWTPTTQELRDHPDWRPMPAGPDNPLGTHALYLDWPAYLIHGTHDTRKIGRPSSSGCIGTFNANIAILYDLCPIGTRVKIL